MAKGNPRLRNSLAATARPFDVTATVAIQEVLAVPCRRDRAGIDLVTSRELYEALMAWQGAKRDSLAVQRN